MANMPWTLPAHATGGEVAFSYTSASFPTSLRGSSSLASQGAAAPSSSSSSSIQPGLSATAFSAIFGAAAGVAAGIAPAGWRRRQAPGGRRRNCKAVSSKAVLQRPEAPSDPRIQGGTSLLSQSTEATPKTAVVVGGGVGGLAMAGRLAKAGFQVTLLEKNSSVGGRMRSEIFDGSDDEATLRGHRFDTGPSLLLLPEIYREAFAAIDEKLEDYLDLVRVEPTLMRVHFAEDWSSLDLLYDMEAMRRQLEDVEVGAGQQYFRWLGEARASLDLGLRDFVKQPSNSILDFLDPRRVGPLAWNVGPITLLASQLRQLSSYFKSDKIKALFSYHNLYIGLRPSSSPGVFSLLAATELTDGVWYPVGGFAKVRDAFQKLAEAKGAKIRTGAEVEAIVVDGAAGQQQSCHKVSGVRLTTGEELTADLVVANADLPYVYKDLLAGQYPGVEKDAHQVVEEMDYSCSMIEFCWSLNQPLKQLAHHNVFLGKDYEGSWQRPCTVKDLKTRHSFNFYVHRPTCSDPSAAPEGKDNIMIEFPIGNERERLLESARQGLSEPDSDAALVDACREAVIKQLNNMGYAADGDFRKMITGERVIRPSEWKERYNIQHGAVFGLSHNLLQLACLRPPRRTGLPRADPTQVQGLHFVGASTRPGNGVPLVLMGVDTVFQEILEEQGLTDGFSSP